MPSLSTVGHRFQTQFQRLDGVPFFGTIQPAGEGSIPSADFIPSRLLLRVPSDCIIATKDVVVDAFSRHFLLCDHDQTPWYRVHRLVQLNRNAAWKRAATTTDTLTQLQKGTTTSSLGSIWVAWEPFGREPIDLTLRVSESVRRVLTGSDVLLNDLIDNQVVKRLDNILGVWLAEVQ